MANIQSLPQQAQLAGTIKVYEVVKNSTFTYRNLEIRHNGMSFLWANLIVKFMRSPVLNMVTQSPEGPVVAGAKFTGFSSDVDVVIGDPVNASPENYISVQREGVFSGGYSFPAVDSGQIFQWRRTHNKAFGVSRLSNSDFKLVDPSNGDKVLAVYVKDSFAGGPSVAHIDFMVELGGDLELQVITSILGIEERLRRKRSNNASAGSASASASASAAC